jgi:hypothetical protein
MSEINKPRRGRPPKTIGEKIASQMTKLDAREKKIAKRETKRITFDATLADWEKVLTLAERWDEQLAVVLRAALRQGLDHYLNWAGNSAPYSPLSRGDLHQARPAHKLDPSGLNFPPPPVQTFNPGMVSAFRPPSRQTTREFVEPMFGPPEMVRVGRRGPAVPIAALLPNGATDSSAGSEIPDHVNTDVLTDAENDLAAETGIFDETVGA